MNHHRWMEHCLNLARQAGAMGEVPVAAAVVQNDELVADAYNQPISSADPTAHAEILALRRAAEKLGNYRLPDCLMYVTLEPCAMCAGALVHARIAHLVFAVREPRAGAVVSRQYLLDAEWLNHRVTYEEGPLAEASGQLLRDFFDRRRSRVDTAEPRKLFEDS